MQQNRHVLLSIVGGLALSVAMAALAAAAPAQAPAHAAPAPAQASPAEPAHVAAGPVVQQRATPQQATPRQTSPAPTNANAVGSNASDDRRGSSNQHEHHQDRNQNLNNGYAYYPLAPAYDYWNPYWNPYDNYNGPVYPGQFTQPDVDESQPDQSLSAPTLPQIAPAPPPVPETDSAALKAALIASPQWHEADEQVRIAQSEYDAASAIVLAQLRTQPAYQEALAQKAADAQKLHSIKKADPGAPIARTESAATAKLTVAQTVTQMETAALAADPRASTAKTRLDAAIADRLEIRRQIESALPKPAIPARQGREH